MNFIDCIIVNYKQLNNCINLFSILEREKCIKKIICVDNSGEILNFFKINSNDNLKLKIIDPGTNIGFGRANNLGASFCDSLRILFCNPDIYFHFGTLDKINKLYDNLNSKDLGFCFNMKDSNNLKQNSHSRIQNRSIFLINQLGLSFLLPISLRTKYFNLKSNDLVDQPIGAFLLLKKEHYFSVGGFDEDFFVYYEDLHLFFKLNLQYKKMRYLDDISIFHKGGESSKDSIVNMLELQINGKKIYFKKRGWKKMSNFYLFFEYILKIICYRKHISRNQLNKIFKSYIK